MRLNILLLLLLLALPAWAQLPQPGLDPAQAGNAVEERGPFGRIDWSRYRVTATGYGAPPQGEEGSKAEAMAARMAVVDARRNLLEVVGGVRVDAVTRVADFMAVDDRVTSRVAGMLRGSAVDFTERLPDGAYRARVSMPLTGSLGRELLSLLGPSAADRGIEAPGGRDPLLVELAERVRRLEARPAGPDQELAARLERLDRRVEALESERQAQRQAPAPATAPETPPREQAEPGPSAQAQANARRLNALEARLEAMAAGPTSAPVAAPAQPAPASAPAASITQTASLPAYTGLVVDARGLDFAPSLQPAISGPEGLLYPGPWVSANLAAGQGFARYYRDLAAAQESGRAGDRPLTVRATGLTAEGGLRLGAADARALGRLAERPENPLAAGRVVIVY